MKIHTFEAAVYTTRRAALVDKLNGETVLLLGNRESSVNFKDNWYPFRQDSNFLYFAGLNVPDIDIIIEGSTGKTILFGDELTIEHIIWTGPLPSLAELAEKVGIDEVRSHSDLAGFVDKNTLYLPPYRPDHTLRLSQFLKIDGATISTHSSESLIEAVVALRNIKSPEEITTLHEACTNTSHMHLELMSKARPGMHEYDLVGLAKSYASSRNVDFSFLPICTTRGHVLHNHFYDNQIQKGDMVLFDGGLESKLHYAGDMTRTFPVDRKFNAKQADLYQVVLNAQKSAIKACSVGQKFLDVHLKSCLTLVTGLSELGIMKGDVETAVSEGAHTMFFQCGLGHMMGLDVHDMESLGEQYVGYGGGMLKSKEFGLKSLRLGRELEEGFVITIEPGIYIIPELIDKFKAEGKYTEFIDYDELAKYRDFGGIRIEDDYLIKNSGIELLGEPLAKEIKEVEAIRAQAIS